MEDQQHDDDDDNRPHDAPTDDDLDPALDPSLVETSGEAYDGDARRAASQLPSSSAAHELADALDDGSGQTPLADGPNPHTLPQAFWDALPLGDAMQDRGRQTASSSHTPTMEDLHAVMSHDSNPHPYGHPDDAAHYDPFDPPQSDSAGDSHHGHVLQQSEGQDALRSDQTQSRQRPLQSPRRPHQGRLDGQQHHEPHPPQPQLYIPSTSHRPEMPLTAAAQPPSRSPEPKPNRKETHKMVERKRREVITRGINEIAELLPEPEKNKSLILGQAVDYIRQLKKAAVSDHEKWAMERTMMAQAMADLRAMLADERGKRRELEQTLHGIGRSAGLSGYGDTVFENSTLPEHPPSVAADDSGQGDAKRGPDEEASDFDRPPKQPRLN